MFSLYFKCSHEASLLIKCLCKIIEFLVIYFKPLFVVTLIENKFLVASIAVQKQFFYKYFVYYCCNLQIKFNCRVLPILPITAITFTLHNNSILSLCILKHWIV